MEKTARGPGRQGVQDFLDALKDCTRGLADTVFTVANPLHRNPLRTPTMNTCTRTLIAAAALSLAAGSALAQQAGVYTGTTSDGNGISFTVTADPDTGALTLTSLGLGFVVNCKKSGHTIGYGTGTGDNTPIVGNSIARTYTYVNFYEKILISFAGSGASGHFVADVPVYKDSATGFATESCASGRMNFTASLTPAVSAAKPLPAGTATLTVRGATR